MKPNKKNLSTINIHQLSTHSEEVLQNQRQKIKRKAALLKAMMLEGIDQTEVILTYQDQVELKKMKTRVIATEDDSVILPFGLILPIHCILDVEFLHA